MNVSYLIEAIKQLLDEPNPADPLMIEAAQLYSNNYEEYVKRAKQTK